MTTRSTSGKRKKVTRSPKNICEKFGCKNGPIPGEKVCHFHKNTPARKDPEIEPLSCREKRRRQEFRRRIGRGQELRPAMD